MKPASILTLLLAVFAASTTASENLVADLIRHDLPVIAPNSTPFVYLDSASWCQYLVTPAGGITPRLNREGQPICVNLDSLKNE